MTDPMQNPLLLANIPPDSLNRLKDKLGAASPAEPIVQMELEIRIEGELRWNRLICRTLWGAETDERYMGIAGTLIDVHDEYRHITSLKEEIYHYEVENNRLNIIGHERNGHSSWIRCLMPSVWWMQARIMKFMWTARALCAKFHTTATLSGAGTADVIIVFLPNACHKRADLKSSSFLVMRFILLLLIMWRWTDSPALWK